VLAYYNPKSGNENEKEETSNEDERGGLTIIEGLSSGGPGSELKPVIPINRDV
jgi:hypothetical protein